MKKLFLILALSFVCSAFADSSEPAPKRTRQEIQMTEASLPAPTYRPRTALPYTSAWVDYITKSIEVRINYYMGQLEITIADSSGQVVHDEMVNSDVVPSIQMPIPDSGTYRITIRGEEYLAEGDFTIE